MRSAYRSPRPIPPGVCALWASLALFLQPGLGLQAQSQYFSAWVTSHFADLPAQSSAGADPDGDGAPNLVEFALGTNPRLAGDTGGTVGPLVPASNGLVQFELLEKAGLQPGVQLKLDLSADLVHWVQPWWQRDSTAPRLTDPPGAARERLSTWMAPTNRCFARCRAQLVTAGAETATYYVSTNGSDSNTGTSLTQPFATLAKAAGKANPGNLIYLRGGTYKLSAPISLSRNGTPAQPIRVRACPGESVLFDFSAEATGSDGVSISGSCWQLFGLEITNAGHNGIRFSGASNVLECCVVHHCRDTGIHITGTTNTSFNLVLNCDSYRNYDPDTHGQNADGFSAKWILGPGNTFRGCRSWENADDGWDLWMATNPVTIDQCWAFRMGTNVFGDPAWEGNGNGFKLGGNYVATPHRIVHSLAFGNCANGFDQNNNLAGQTVDQNTSWGNLKANFDLKHGANTTPHVLRNNLSWGGGSGDSFTSGSRMTNNSWQVLSSVSTNDVLSIDATLAQRPRQPDGSLPDLPFLRPKPRGRLTNVGVDLGEPCSGSAPDLGAYESIEWP